jgi:ribokinase
LFLHFPAFRYTLSKLPLAQKNRFGSTRNMHVLNIGSINIDHVYRVEHFVRPGETLGSSHYHTFAGGKGFNQSVALARAGASTLHAGRVGNYAEWLLERLGMEGVDTTFVRRGETATGHAIIQVVPSGENAIVLHGGANHCVTVEDVKSAISSCVPGDYLLIQNETSAVAEAIQQAHGKGLRIVFNPAPMAPGVHQYPLDLVDIFILNETEAQALFNTCEPESVRMQMRELFPRAAAVLTLGDQGAIYFDADCWHHEPALHVTAAIDTTAAGDTFVGFFLAELMRTGNPRTAMAHGCAAAAICVTRAGATDSIPLREEVELILQG